MLSKISKNKKGLSAVIAVVLLIALTMVIISVVWVVVNNLVREEIDTADACFAIFDKVSLNNRYTCYNSTAELFQFSINIADLEVDEVLVGISGGGSSASFKISSEDSIVNNVVYYPDGSSNLVKLPGKNSGTTYLFDMSAAGFSGAPDSISIAPIIKENQCGVSDSSEQIDNCALLA